ncbi:response regulator [bacterium]|jgi:CheY-like chemotaxis protein|nr:response regulator [bacterium]
MENLDQQKKKLLLIDDEEGVLQALSLLLGALGHQVFPFSDPVKALQEVTAISPDWIITDLRMPEIDGFGVIEKRNTEYPHIPVILISGHAQEDEIEKAKSLGVKAVLQKPFDPSALTSLINQD